MHGFLSLSTKIQNNFLSKSLTSQVNNQIYVPGQKVFSSTENTSICWFVHCVWRETVSGTEATTPWEAFCPELLWVLLRTLRTGGWGTEMQGTWRQEGQLQGKDCTSKIMVSITELTLKSLERSGWTWEIPWRLILRFLAAHSESRNDFGAKGVSSLGIILA